MEQQEISIYVTAGGHLEKNVSGRLTTGYVVNSKTASTGKEKISLERLQWSINTPAGFKYNLTRNIGLYMEPGAGYYFPNKSGIETIHTEKPLNLSLRIGISFSLGGKNSGW